MILKPYILNMIFLLFTFYGCEEVEGPSGSDRSGLSGDWLIPENQIFDGGPGKDGIPALTNPNFISASAATYLNANDLVVIYKSGTEVRAYPHALLNWHEIVNDDLNNDKVTISYCPLTGSAMAYDQTITVDGAAETTTFGVSGLLYNSNLILYDRLTDSYWSQMRLQCVAGELKGREPDVEPIIETTLATAKAMYPGLKVLSNQTGVYSSGQYNFYPYGDYLTNHDALIFPISNDDSRLPRKERVLGILTDELNRVYQFEHLSKTGIINDKLGDLPVVVIGGANMNFMAAFIRHDANGNEITLSKTNRALPIWIEDEKGNLYDVFGEVIEGPDKGYQLKQAQSYIAFWFAFGAFYPGIEIYDK